MNHLSSLFTILFDFSDNPSFKRVKHWSSISPCCFAVLFFYPCLVCFLVSAFYVPFSPWFHGHLLLFYVCWTSQCHAWVFLLLPVLGASHSVEWLLHHIDLHQLPGADIHAACCVEIMNLQVTVVIWSHWGCMVALHHHRSCLLLLKVTEHVGDCYCCSDHSVFKAGLPLFLLPVCWYVVGSEICISPSFNSI